MNWWVINGGVAALVLLAIVVQFPCVRSYLSSIGASAPSPSAGAAKDKD